MAVPDLRYGPDPVLPAPMAAPPIMPLPSHHPPQAFKLVEIFKILIGTEKNLISFVRVNYLKDETENKHKSHCGEHHALPACLEPSASVKEKDN